MEELLKKIEKKFPQYKFNNPKKLGSGENGVAYDIGNDIVLKITQSASEAHASAVVKNEKLRYVNDIYDVFSFDYEGKVKYLIFQELLKPITDEESRNMIDDFCEFIMQKRDYWELTFPKQGIIKATNAFFKFCKGEEYYDRYLDQKPFFKTLYEFIMRSVRELHNYHIDFEDYNSGNIMLDNKGEYKLIDLMSYYTPKRKIPHKILESFKERFNRRN